VFCRAGILKRLPDISITDDLIEETKEANQCKMFPTVALQASTVAAACEKVLTMVNEDDRIIIFGSFYTVAEAMQFFEKVNNNGVEFVA